MESKSRNSLALELMTEFIRNTGLNSPDTPLQRYLWTDAFAVCNLLELSQQDKNCQEMAVLLVNQVHHTLGRHRIDSTLKGWISGLNEKYGELHPTKGGLRIGKSLPERDPQESLNEQLEWDRDGQYYHYLTKWMHTLNQTGKVNVDPRFILWAIELAKTAHESFTYLPSPDVQKRMYWKMGTDLKTPLVPAMGQHDPLDGYITYNELQSTAVMDFGSFTFPDLTPEIVDMREICQGLHWTTDDPLGIGGLLWDSFRIVQLISKGHGDLVTLLGSVLNDARLGLDYYSRGNSLNLPSQYRLAFRELGLSIGLRGVERLLRFTRENSRIIDPEQSLEMQLKSLMEYVPLAGKIEEFWLKYENQRSTNWTEHRDINMVMLATSLIPDGFLRI